jgi:hypothetical protein
MQMRALRTRLVVSYNLVPCIHDVFFVKYLYLFWCWSLTYTSEVLGAYEHERCLDSSWLR